MHTSSILWYLSWPAFIVASYYLIRWFLRKAEQKNPPVEDSE